MSLFTVQVWPDPFHAKERAEAVERRGYLLELLIRPSLFNGFDKTLKTCLSNVRVNVIGTVPGKVSVLTCQAERSTYMIMSRIAYSSAWGLLSICPDVTNSRIFGSSTS